MSNRVRLIEMRNEEEQTMSVSMPTERKGGVCRAAANAPAAHLRTGASFSRMIKLQILDFGSPSFGGFPRCPVSRFRGFISRLQAICRHGNPLIKAAVPSLKVNEDTPLDLVHGNDSCREPGTDVVLCCDLVAGIQYTLDFRGERDAPTLIGFLLQQGWILPCDWMAWLCYLLS